VAPGSARGHEPVYGGETKTITVDLGEADLWFAVQVHDRVGNLSLISPATVLSRLSLLTMEFEKILPKMIPNPIAMAVDMAWAR